MSKERDELLNIASQCRATASNKIAQDILVDAGSGCLRDLLLDAAKALEALAQPKPEQELLDLDRVDKHLEICDKSEEYRDGYSDGIIFAERQHGMRGQHE